MLRHIALLPVLAGLAFPASAETVSITDITVTDELGYECIEGKHLEDSVDGLPGLAFRISAKVRLPRTCLPEPCARALEPRELSSLTGTEMSLPKFQREWDEYYARYADHCRKEIVPFTAEEQLPPMTPDLFWEPFTRPPITTDDLITTVPRLPVPGSATPTGPFSPWLPGAPGADPIYIGSGLGDPTIARCSVIGPRNGYTGRHTSSLVGCDPAGSTSTFGSGTSGDGPDPVDPGSPPLPTPVPLPASLTLLLAALAGLRLMPRRAAK